VKSLLLILIVMGSDKAGKLEGWDAGKLEGYNRF
jgi:hypothetical protein